MICNPSIGQRVQLWYADKWRGWARHHGATGTVVIASRGRPRNHYQTKKTNTLEIPNYTGDLNAMHEAGLWMESNATSKCDIYATQLSYVINPKNGQVGDFRYLHATARQRAEAFLRTVGRWTE